MTAERGYGSPDAFRRALTDRLRAAARESRWGLPQLQRQMAYDRLLERLYFVDDGWIVKGSDTICQSSLRPGPPRRSESVYLTGSVHVSAGKWSH